MYFHRLIIPGLAPLVMALIVLAEPAWSEEAPSDGVFAGLVLNASGIPVPGASISLTPVTDQGGGTQNRIRSDAQGRFRFAGLPRQKLSLLIQAKGYVLYSARDELGPQDILNYRAVLTRSLVLEGSVVDDAGRPLSGATISAVPVGESKSRGDGDRSRSDGSFKLSRLTSGKWRVSATHPDGGRGMALVDLGTESEPLTIRLSESPSIVGRLLTPDGQVLRSGSVELSGPLPEGSASSLYQQGEFVFYPEKSGTYRLKATFPGFLPGVRTLKFEGKKVHRLDWVMDPGCRVSGLILGVEPADVSRLSVRAISQEGHRPQAAKVYTDGRFEVTGLAPGAWRLVGGLHRDGRIADQELTVGAEDRELSLDLEFHGDTVILEGEVRHNGELAAYTTILTKSRTSGTTSDQNGNFRLQGVNPGPFVLEILGPWGKHIYSGHTESAGRIRVDISSEELSGRLFDAEGVPVVGSEVLVFGLFDGQWNFLSGPPTEEGGIFHFPALSSGEYWLVGQDMKNGVTIQKVSLIKPLRDLSLRFAKKEKLAFVAVPPLEQEAAENINVVVLDDQERTLAMLPLYWADGRLETDLLPRGDWNLSVAQWGKVPIVLRSKIPGGPIEISFQTATDLEIFLPEGVQKSALIEIRDSEGEVFSAQKAGFLLSK